MNIDEIQERIVHINKSIHNLEGAILGIETQIREYATNKRKREFELLEENDRVYLTMKDELRKKEDDLRKKEDDLRKEKEVYANKAAFDAENAVPLRSSVLTGLESSKSSDAKPLPKKPNTTQLDVTGDLNAKQQKTQDIKSIQLSGLYQYSTIECHELPSLDELKAVLLKPLPFRLQITNSSFANLIFENDAPLIECKELEALIDTMTIKYRTRPRPCASELDWQEYYDRFLDVILGICLANGVDIVKQRNKEDPTNPKNYPDCFIRYDELLLLRGEENCTTTSLRTSYRNITNKMLQWNPIFYGDLPYIFGYATSGGAISVMAIDRNLRPHDIIPMQDRASIMELPFRAMIFTFFYNLTFFFSTMIKHSKKMGITRIFPFTPADNGKRIIELLDSGIQRTIVRDTNDIERFDRLIQIYQSLEYLTKTHPEKIIYLQTVSRLKVSNDKLVVLLNPMGYEMQPENEFELWHMIYCILNGLSYWHKLNYCHGDIKWRNIIHVPIEKYWMLIDMDESFPPNMVKITWNHPLKGHTLMLQHDLYQVGKLTN